MGVVSLTPVAGRMRPPLEGNAGSHLSRAAPGLHFELLLQSDPVGLSCAPAMVKAANNTQFVVNHMGDPDIHDGQMARWAAAMAELAKLPNVVMKVRGCVRTCEADAGSSLMNGVKRQRSNVVYVCSAGCTHHLHHSFRASSPACRRRTATRGMSRTLSHTLQRCGASLARAAWPLAATGALRGRRMIGCRRSREVQERQWGVSRGPFVCRRQIE